MMSKQEHKPGKREFLEAWLRKADALLRAADEKKEDDGE